MVTAKTRKRGKIRRKPKGRAPAQKNAAKSKPRAKRAARKTAARRSQSARSPRIVLGAADADISSMLDELQAVIEETESAANRFMAAAEALDRLAANSGSGMASRIVALTGGIFEASAFRDITGQRLDKVMRQLHGLNGNGRGAKANARRSRAQSQAGNPANDERRLLNGPQLANVGCSQADVDALLASFD